MVHTILALLERQRPLDDILSHVILLAQVKQLSDLRGSLGPETSGLSLIC